MAAKQRGQPTRALVRQPIVQAPLAQLPAPRDDETCCALGRTRAGAVILPVPPPVADLPSRYPEALAELKLRIQQTRLVAVLTANAAMIRLSWRVGSVSLAKQERAGWFSTDCIEPPPVEA